MTKTNRTGFTLVELLVVISIISMLVGLLLPAINAAREAGRRTACMSNQSNVAFALLNYANTRGNLPPLRANLLYSGGGTTSGTFATGETGGTGTAVGHPAASTELTWIGFILPYIEQNNAWERIVSATFGETDYDLVLPIFHCKSSGISSSDSRINYVANAGAQNATTASDTSSPTLGVEYLNQAYNGTNGPYKPEENRRYGVFFDHFVNIDRNAGTGSTALVGDLCNTVSRIDYISANNGTSYTIMISENIDAGNWIWGTDHPIAYVAATTSGTTTTADPLTYGEDLVGFCYPHQIVTAGTGSAGGAGTSIGEPAYVSLTVDATAGADINVSPLFINEGRPQSGVVCSDPYRTARPSSNHPGVVLAAFADRSVRPLKDDMNRMLFVHICRPASGVVVNPADLD